MFPIVVNFQITFSRSPPTLRFRDRFGKQNPRKVVHVWAEKEMHNLCVMRRAGLQVPDPVVLKKHVLVMSMVGAEDGTPSPKIKDAVLSR